MIQAAGILFRAPSGRVLLLQRSEEGDAAGTWAIPGGKLEKNETAEQAAFRECFEEMKYRGSPGKLLLRRVKDGVDYSTFLNECDGEFTPVLNEEHISFAWVDPSKLGMAALTTENEIGSENH